jgi:hypothetical protein
MSVSGTFNAAVADVPARRGRKHRAPPFSLRLSEADRARLAVEAAGAPLGAYIKAKVLGNAVKVRVRRSGLSVQDRQALGKALALLGQSRIASNLNQLALAANTGSLDLDPETAALLTGALDDVRALRRLLLSALGLKADASP